MRFFLLMSIVFLKFPLLFLKMLAFAFPLEMLEVLAPLLLTARVKRAYTLLHVQVPFAKILTYLVKYLRAPDNILN
jgi:hypothetical protein